MRTLLTKECGRKSWRGVERRGEAPTDCTLRWPAAIAISLEGVTSSSSRSFPSKRRKARAQPVSCLDLSTVEPIGA